MTPDQYDEVVGWIEVRWPHLRWNSVTVAALYQDLEHHDPVDVWAAVHRLYEQGREHPPSPSTIVAEVLEERHQNATRERLATPAIEAGDEIHWSAYARATYGEPISLWEAAKLEHGRTLTQCRSPLCDLHPTSERTA